MPVFGACQSSLSCVGYGFYDRNRVCCWGCRGLTGIERPDYDVVVSFGLPSKPGPSRSGKSRLIAVVKDAMSPEARG